VVKKNSDVAGRPVLVTTVHRGVFFGYAVALELVPVK